MYILLGSTVQVGVPKKILMIKAQLIGIDSNIKEQLLFFFFENFTQIFQRIYRCF